MMGAAILAARACMRSGAGLLTTHLPGAGYPIVQAAVPESIFSLDDSETIYTTNPNLERFAAIAAGPGIGTGVQTAEALRLLIMSWFKPLVLDADALNIMAAHPQLLAMLPENTILTPHPGEFDRLAGPSESGYERNQRQIEFSIKYHVITLLKGAHTSIAMPDGRCWFNSTGNPGMATAGSGDVLTGIILSLLSQGLSPEEAAITGTYIHGLSGDLAAKKSGQQALIASDIVNHIGYAFKTLERNETSPW
jgi:NAD(P)H-hydrate epimerase